MKAIVILFDPMPSKIHAEDNFDPTLGLLYPSQDSERQACPRRALPLLSSPSLCHCLLAHTVFVLDTCTRRWKTRCIVVRVEATRVTTCEIEHSPQQTGTESAVGIRWPTATP